MTRTLDRRLVAVVGLVALLAIAVPVLGADPSARPEPPRQAKQDKAAKGPKVEGTLRGFVQQTTDGKGGPTFTMTVDGLTWGR